MKKFFSRGTELGLLILAAIVFAITLVSLELSQDNALTMDLVYLIGGFIGVFTVAHLVMCFLAPYADQIMLPIVAVLNAVTHHIVEDDPPVEDAEDLLAPAERSAVEREVEEHADDLREDGSELTNPDVRR